jgi:hypothetical protein
MLGEPRDVYATRNAAADFVTVRFVDEAVCHVVGGSVAREGLRTVMPVYIQGTAGTIYVERVARVKGQAEDAAAYLMNDKRKGARLKKITASSDTGHADKSRARHFVDALRNDTPLICDLEDSVRTSEFLHAIWNSYSLGICVPIQRRQRTG